MSYQLEELKGKTALVTGASSGIGLSCADMLAEQGVKLKLTARRGERLKSIKTVFEDEYKADVEILAGDINDPKFISELESNGFLNVDILINNAGLALGKDPLHQISDEDLESMVLTNLTSSIKVVKRSLASMISNKKGDIVNICSISSHESYAGGGVYCATKHGLLALAKSIRQETHGQNIRVVSVSPGMVETEFSEVRFGGDKQAAKSVYSGMKPLEAQDIAYQVLHALQMPRHVNLDEILILPTDQASATSVKRN